MAERRNTRQAGQTLATLFVACALSTPAPAREGPPASIAELKGNGKETAFVPRRVNNRSPAFRVHEDDLGFFMNYSAYAQGSGTATNAPRFFERQIGPKALSMIGKARKHILLSVFLFDSFYVEGTKAPDLVGALTDAIIARKRQHPDMHIAIILDPSHKAYGNRVSPAEKKLRENGVDVFYSDLVSGLRKASFLGVREGLGHTGRLLDRVTFGLSGKAGSALFSRARLPASFDGDPLTLESAYNAFLLKANHRKLLVTDIDGGDYEALVTSANPHNASAYHINSAISVRGRPARWIFNVLREDMRKSAGLGTRFTHWHTAADRRYRKRFFDACFPLLELGTAGQGRSGDDRSATAVFVTEQEIVDSISRMLGGVTAGDEIRIQMFYLSYKPVLEAILDASCTTRKPVRLLLDASKDAFNREKDGTPNRQVARYLLAEAAKRGGRIEIRWYLTHGEQNHAKVMSISDPERDRYLITTGSCNWTGRNMAGVNMESNINVEGSRKITETFNRLFDRFWTNADGRSYSEPYETYRDTIAPDWKWHIGEAPYFYSTF